MKGVAADLVIPTVGRPSLARLLLALAACRGPLPDNVYLVDDRRQPEGALNLPDLPAGWQSRITILPGKSAGPAAARNTGWSVSSGTWIAFLDDDVVPSNDWLERLEKDLAHASPDVAASQGRVYVPLSRDRRPTDWERNVRGLETALWITADMAYRRQTLITVGGFDERFPRAFREDADLAIRVQAAGYKLSRGSREVGHPAGPSSFWTSLRLQAGNADDAMMRALHGPGWRTLAKAGPSRLPQHLFTTVALFWAILGGSSTRRSAMSIWAGLTAGFAAKRIYPGPGTPAEICKMVATSALIPPAAVFHRLRGELLARSLPEKGRRVAQQGVSSLEPNVANGASFGQTAVRAVLFDRDGTLVEDVAYNGDPEKVSLKPGAAEAIQRLRAAGLPTAVVSNQSGVARGFLSTEQVRSVNNRIEQILGPLGPWVICEHGPEEGCICRKPEPGMILEAARRLGVDPRECVVVGDIGADIDAAHKAGAASILVPGPITLPEEIAAAPVVVPNLSQAVDLILGNARPDGAGK